MATLFLHFLRFLFAWTVEDVDPYGFYMNFMVLRFAV